jgi:hypothetical protein
MIGKTLTHTHTHARGGDEHMATEAVEAMVVGKRWVEETFRRIAGELNLPVEGLQWRDDYPGPYICSLYFNVRNTPQNIEFRMSQIEGARNPNNRPVRSTLEEQIRSSLQEISQH